MLAIDEGILTITSFFRSEPTMQKNTGANIAPINQIFKYLQQQTQVSIWLYQQPATRLSGVIRGFDEFMNLTLDEAVEVNVKDPSKRRQLGMVVLKGENVTLISAV